MSRTDLLDEDLISINALAKELSVSVSTVWRWILKNELESVKIFGRRYVTRESFRRMVARNNGEAVPVRTNRQRQAEQRDAHRDLVKAGLLDDPRSP